MLSDQRKVQLVQTFSLLLRDKETFRRATRLHRKQINGIIFSLYCLFRSEGEVPKRVARSLLDSYGLRVELNERQKEFLKLWDKKSFGTAPSLDPTEVFVSESLVKKTA